MKNLRSHSCVLKRSPPPQGQWGSVRQLRPLRIFPSHRPRVDLKQTAADNDRAFVTQIPKLSATVFARLREPCRVRRIPLDGVSRVGRLVRFNFPADLFSTFGL